MADSAVRLTSLSHGGGCGCKIAPGVLTDLLQDALSAQPAANLLVGRESDDDAAVYKLNDEQAVVSTMDFFMPIVDDPYDFGRIAAANALSDIYAMGGAPILALAIAGMPLQQLPAETIRKIFQGGDAICAEAGINVAGGHSIESVEPIYGLSALGLVHPDNVRRNTHARPGDVLIQGKPVGVGIYSAALKKQQLDQAGYEALIATTTQLNKIGTELARMESVHALTDVTGFGFLGHMLEICQASGVGAQVQADAVPLLPQTRALARGGHVTGASGRNWASYGEHIQLASHVDELTRALLCDPQTSGGLMAACAPEASDEVLDRFVQAGFAQAAIVGHCDDKAGQISVA